MPGTSETSIFEKDGQYLSFTAVGSITLGDVVELIPATIGSVQQGTADDVNAFGVAISGNRVSRVATDNVVASGNLVTVCTRGVVNVTCTGTVTCGEFVCAGASGAVKTQATSGPCDNRLPIGVALSTATNGTVKIKLLNRG